MLEKRSSINGSRTSMTKADFVDNLASVWFECLTPQNIRSGFVSTGVFPVDRKKYPVYLFDTHLLKRYENWNDTGRKEEMLIMAASRIGN